ncbi:hypothetical protein D3C74_236910 [compost metagenome]
MLGILQDQQRVDEQRAAYLLVTAPWHSRYPNFERKIIRPGQVPGTANGHPDFAGNERIAVLPGNALAPLGVRRHLILENKIEQLVISCDHFRGIEMRLRRYAAVRPGVCGIRLRAEV